MHATLRWMASDEGFPRGGLRGYDDANERWFGRGNDFGSQLLFRRVRGAFELVFPCCEVGAAVFGPMVMMPCGGGSGCCGLLRRESCISPLRSSLSELELPVSYARSHLFGIGRHRLHETVAVGSSLVVVLR
jgi:hypothetical protein